MIVVIILGLISVLFANLAKYRSGQWGLKLSFILIFFFLALRYNFGNDYNTYLNAFIAIGQCDSFESIDNPYQFEPGWVWLNWAFRSFGFFAMTATLAFFNCIVYYRFIKKYVPPGYYWLAVFLYIFYPDFMLVHASAMRQSIATMIFVFSLDYLYKKDAIRYFFCVGLASLFHFSALILLPVYFLGAWNWRLNGGMGAILVLIFASLFLSGEFLAQYLRQFINAYFEKYTVYENAGAVNTGLGFLYFFIMLVLTIYYERFQNREIALIFKIAIIGFMLMPLNLIIELFGRLGMYFMPAVIVVYPMICINFKKPLGKLIFLTLLLVFTTCRFFQFFYSDTYKDGYGNYQTILSASQNN